jgi:hypothetical protein
MLNAHTVNVIRKRAKELADAAPELTTEQAALLVSVFHQYPDFSARERRSNDDCRHDEPVRYAEVRCVPTRNTAAL